MLARQKNKTFSLWDYTHRLWVDIIPTPCAPWRLPAVLLQITVQEVGGLRNYHLSARGSVSEVTLSELGLQNSCTTDGPCPQEGKYSHAHRPATGYTTESCSCFDIYKNTQGTIHKPCCRYFFGSVCRLKRFVSRDWHIRFQV